jgi:hypothetical protein
MFLILDAKSQSLLLINLCMHFASRFSGGCYGKDQFVVMFGGLHIEMNALKLLGDLLDSSGWTGALTQASGTADSYLKVSHVTCTRHAHQLTASSLHILLHKAYTEYSSSQEDEEALDSLEAWCDERAKNRFSSTWYTIFFWYTILQLQFFLHHFAIAISGCRRQCKCAKALLKCTALSVWWHV